jgi:hypothetical protein
MQELTKIESIFNLHGGENANIVSDLRGALIDTLT